MGTMEEIAHERSREQLVKVLLIVEAMEWV